MRYPFDGTYEITQGFGKADAAVKDLYAFHSGIDFALPEGTPVLAVCDGMIQQVGSDEAGYGNYVIVRPNGSVAGYLYGHLSKVAVEQNQYVAEGDVIGYSGNSGLSTGPHLHFEARTQWDKASTAYEPRFSDAVVPTEQEEIFSPIELADNAVSARVVAPSGANLRDDGLNFIGTVSCGVVVELTGEKREDSGIVRRAVIVRGWLAEDDGEDQILKGIS